VRQGAERAISAVESLSADIGIPAYLDDLSIPKSAIADLAKDGMNNVRQIRPNPRDVTYEGLLAILHGAFRP
jgi:alcohol dehydrogenase